MVETKSRKNLRDHVTNFTMACFSFTAAVSPAIALALAVLLVWFTARLVSRPARRNGSSPPGPRPWPIIGNLKLLGSLPHRSLHALSQTYGPLVRLKFGSVNVVVTNSPDMVKEFLKTHDAVFAARPQPASGKHLLCNCSDVLWGNGPQWRQARKIFASHLFSPKRLESYEYIRAEERRDFLARLYDLKGKRVRIQDHLSRINLSVMSRIVLGRNYFSDSKLLREETPMTHEEMLEMFDESFELSGAFVVGDWVPWLARFDLGGYVKRMKNLSQRFCKFFDFLVQVHTKSGNRQPQEGAIDMMGVLLDLVDDPKLEVKLTDDHVQGLTLDLLAAGTESASTTVEWAMAELMKNPEMMKTATEELDRVIGRDRWVEEEDMPNLPYLDAILKETFRLHPASAFLPPHLSTEDTQIKHYHFPKGTIALVNVWSMGRNPAVWDSPEEFRPERFLNKAFDVKGLSFEFIPFGSGRRICPGYALGLKMVQSTLANMLHGFNWALPPEMKPQDMDMEEIHGLTTPRKHPLVVVPEPRLTPHLYASI
uniref:Cytochrome P450 n=1 Tax=Kalanchoe fedtschenkoi TaxID=63787 RepID=A0A7N0SW96_KALFE